MPLRFAHAGDFHLDEDRYFTDTAQCLEWFVADAIRASVDLFVINGDLTTYKATIRERNFWVDRLVETANLAPVILVAGNHGAELEGDLYVFGRARGAHPIYVCTEPEFIELGKAAVAVFPYPRKAVMASNEHSPGGTFARQLDEFNRRFDQRSGCYKLFFGHLGVASARVSSGQPLVGLPDFQYAGAGSVSCAQDGVALGDEAGGVGGMDGSLQAASLADLKEGLING